MPSAERPAEPFSIVSLAAGIAALVLALFAVLPLVGMCFLPLSALGALTALVTGLVSLVRLWGKPELDGRQQAATGLGLSLVWCLAAGLLLVFASRMS